MTRIVYIEANHFSGPPGPRPLVQSEDQRFNAYDRERQDESREETQFRSVDRLMRTKPGFDH